MRYIFSLIFLAACFIASAQLAAVNNSPFRFSIEPVQDSGVTTNLMKQGFRFSGVVYENMKFRFVVESDRNDLKINYYISIAEIYPDGSLHIVIPLDFDKDYFENNTVFVGSKFSIGPVIYAPPYGNYKTILLLTQNKELYQIYVNSLLPNVRGRGPSLSPERIKEELYRVLRGVPSILFRDAYISTLDYLLLPQPAAIGTILPEALNPYAINKSVFAGPHVAPPGLEPIVADKNFADTSCQNKVYAEPGLLFSKYPMLTFINPAPDVDDFSRGAHIGKVNANKSYVVQGNVSAAKGVKEVRINGEPAILKQLNPVQFYWEKEVTLKPGMNRFSIAAVSAEGAENCDRVDLTYEPANRTVNQTGKNYLLLIGINNYANWPQLHGAVNDLKEIHQLMLDFGFQEQNITELTDGRATLDAIDSAFSSLQARLGLNDNLLIYYAGHGMLDHQLEGRGYWVPVGARKDKRNDFIANDYIKDFIQSFKAKHVLVFADACFSGSLFRNSRGEEKYTERVEQLNSRFVFCSGREEVVDDLLPGKKNSPFAYYLIQALKNVAPGQKISVKELALTVSKNVADAVKQTPVSGPLREAGDEGGEFSFIRKK